MDAVVYVHGLTVNLGLQNAPAWRRRAGSWGVGELGRSYPDSLLNDLFPSIHIPLPPLLYTVQPAP